jgi:hypothetical protein
MRLMNAVLVAALGVGVVACGTVDNIADCTHICDRYRSCFDSNYDTGNCYDRCRTESENDKDHQHKVDVCDACIGGRDCSAAAFNCVDECAGVVP